MSSDVVFGGGSGDAVFDADDLVLPPTVIGDDVIIVPADVPLTIHIGEDTISVWVGDDDETGEDGTAGTTMGDADWDVYRKLVDAIMGRPETGRENTGNA